MLYTHGPQWFNGGPTFAKFTMLSEEAKDKLRQTLDKIQAWPSVYMFKFILEPDQERLDRLVSLFPRKVRSSAGTVPGGGTSV